jgi:hypothetical protein
MASITILDTVAANIATPTTGHTSVFVDDSTGSSVLKMKDSAGVISSVGAAFTGNLGGNSLYDATNNKIIAKAYPINDVVAITNSPVLAATATPSYTSGVLNAPSGTYLTFGLAAQANVIPASSGGTNKQFIGHSFTGQYFATQAMNSNDRTRGANSINSVNLNGFDWGNDGSTSNTRPTHVAHLGTMTVEGSGTIGHVVGASGTVTLLPSGGGAQVSNYVSGNYAIIATQAGNTFTSVSTGTARLYSGALSLNSAHSVTNAIGLHLPSNWAATSGGASITNKYSILSEDTNAKMSHAGVVGIGAFTVAGKPATGVVGDMIAISDQGGKIAYWDTTNTRWSYVWSNLAV